LLSVLPPKIHAVFNPATRPSAISTTEHNNLNNERASKKSQSINLKASTASTTLIPGVVVCQYSENEETSS
jgi:hypothetical protein